MTGGPETLRTYQSHIQIQIVKWSFGITYVLQLCHFVVNFIVTTFAGLVESTISSFSIKLSIKVCTFDLLLTTGGI